MLKPMHRRQLRIGLFFLPILVCYLLCVQVGSCQAKVESKHGGRVEIDVTIRDSSGNFLATQANVKLFLNGTPCDLGSTHDGRISFAIADLGAFTVLVEADGYKPAQQSLIASEPTTLRFDFTLQRQSSSTLPASTADNLLLAPKAKEALDNAMQALRENNSSQAEQALDLALKLAPNNPHVLYVQGLVQLKQHDWAKAQTVLQRVTQMEPNSARAFSALGMALCNQKKYADAIPPLEKSLALDSTAGWETRWALGESYYHNRRFDDALKVSQEAQASSNGQAPQLDLLLARSLTAVGRYDESAKVLRDLLKVHADSPEAVTAQRFLDRLLADGKIPKP
jgi:tetratricopeptide (TPR) repeat protein